jgi:hypothetical protein
VLGGKVRIWIFEEAVHQVDEFAHAGGQGNLGFLARVLAGKPPVRRTWPVETSDF